MNTTSESLWQDWDETTAEASEQPTGGSRRLLLVGAAAGLTLAASGLYVPEWIEETEAREGALGGARGGRRGKNHKGRHKKRTHGDKKSKQKRRQKNSRNGGPLMRSSALEVVNVSSFPLHCTFYYQESKGWDGFGPPMDDVDRIIPGNDRYRYDPDRYRVGVLILLPEDIGPTDFYVDVRNRTIPFYPRGGVTRGRQLDPHNGNVGSAYIPEQNFAVGDAPWQPGVQLRRMADDSGGANRIEWKVEIYA